MVFLGERFVVTVRHGEGSPLHDVRLDLEAHPDLLGIGPSAVLYAVADRIVDDYLAVIDGIAVDVEEVEAEVFSGAGSNPAERIYRSSARCSSSGARSPRSSRRCSGCPTEQAGLPLDPRTAEYFRDVHDHLLRDAERIAGFDELLTNALQANVAQITMRDNQDMRRISAWVAIIAVPTMVFGLYGMNFEHMPELKFTYGYPAVIAVGAAHLRGPLPQVQAHRLALSIVRGSLADVDSLEPLWVAVHHAHAASMPERAPCASDAETWARAPRSQPLIEGGCPGVEGGVRDRPRLIRSIAHTPGAPLRGVMKYARFVPSRPPAEAARAPTTADSVPR